MGIELPIILFVGGFVILLWLFLWSQQRQKLGYIPEAEGNLRGDTVNFSGDGGSSLEAVLVATERGQLIHVNDTMRRWLNIEGGVPNLEYFARFAQPTDNFLELFANTGSATLQFGSRWVEASSHTIPAGMETRVVVVLRELTSSDSTEGYDLSKAITVVGEIGETVNAGLGMEQSLQALLSIVRKALPFDAGEITLFEELTKILNPRGWVGDVGYVLSLMEAGGAYYIGEGITGWIAENRKPVLVPDRDDPAVIRPKLPNSEYRSFVGVPLVLGDRLIGTFEVASVESRRFDQASLALLQAVAKPIAIAIYNAELYTEQAKRIEDLASLQKISATEPAQIFLTINEQIARLLNAEMCGILLYDSRKEELTAQPPFFGIHTAIIQNYTISIPKRSEQRELLWDRGDHWTSSDLADEPLAEAMGMGNLIRAAGMHNTLLMPLQIGGRGVGMIQVGNTRSGGFGLRDIQNLRLMASQAAVIVEDVRLSEFERQRENEMESLQEVTLSLSAISPDENFLKSVTERIAQVMNVQICGVFIHDEITHRLMPQLSFYGADDVVIDGYSVDVAPNTPMDHLWNQEDTWFTNNVLASPIAASAGLDEIAQRTATNKLIFAVLNSGGRRIGIIQALNTADGADFTANDSRMMVIFASQVASMLENTRLFAEAQRRATEAESLRRIAELASAILTPDDTFQPLLGEIAKVMNSPIVNVNTFDREASRLLVEPRMTYGIDLAEDFQLDTFSEGFEHSVAINRRTFMTNDILLDKRVIPGYRALASRIGINSVIQVPLLAGDQSLGELSVCNGREPYEEKDVRLARAIAIHVGAALDRIRLYESTGQNLRRRLQELDAISRVSNELAMTLDYDRVLEVIRAEAVSATEAKGSTMIVLSPSAEWNSPDKPHINRYFGDRRAFTGSGIAPIELEAIKHPEQAIIIDDYLQTGELGQTDGLKPMPEDTRSAIAAAITYESEVIAVIHLYHPQARQFDQRAAAFLTTLAAKASLSYGNTQRFHENQERGETLRRRVDQLNQIFELGQILQSEIDPMTMLEAISFSVQQSCGYDVVLMTLLDGGDGVLKRVSQVGLPLNVFDESKRKVMPLDNLRALLDKREYQIGSESYFMPIERVANWAVEHVDTLAANYKGTRTLHPMGKGDWRDGDLLIVPLTGARGDILGVMSLDRPFDGKRPDRSAVEVLEIFAHQAAATIENSRLYTSSVRSAEQESRLNELMEAISSTLDMNEIVEAVARGVQRIVPFNRLTISLLDSEQQNFDVSRVNVQADQTLEVGRERRPTLTRTALGRTFEEGQDYLYTLNETAGEKFDDLRAWRTEGEQTSLVVPLITGGYCLGAMHLGANSAQVDAYEENRTLIKRIANLSAVAIQNARLFNQAVNLRLFNESVVQSIQQGIVVLDSSARILTVNDYMRRLYGWDDLAIRQDLFAYRPVYQAVLTDALRDVLERGVPHEILNQRIEDVDLNGEPLSLVQNFYVYPMRAADNLRGAVLLVDDVTQQERLERDIAARADQLVALMEVSSRITSALKRDEVITLALDEMARVIGYDSLSFWVREMDSLSLVAWRGYDPADDEMRIKIASNERLGWVIDRQKAISISQFEGRDSLPGETAGGSWLGIPLIQSDQVIGMITLSKTSPRYYTTQSEQAALTFTNQVAIALANAQLFEDTEANTARLSLLNRVSMRLAQSLDTENILEIALNEIATAFRCDKGRAYFYERDAKMGRVVVDYPRGDYAPTAIIELDSKPTIRQVIKTAQPILIGDVASLKQDDPLYDELVPTGMTSYVLIPMSVAGQVTGTFELEFYDGEQHFDLDKLELASIVANQGAIAVMNANLLEQTLARTRELETLLEAAQATSLILDLEEVFESVVGLTMHALNMDDCTLLLYDNVQDTLTVKLNVNRSGDERNSLQKGMSYALKQHPAKMKAIRERQVVVTRRDDPNADAVELADMDEQGDIARMLVPLSSSGEMIGLLQVDLHDQMRTFTHREIRMAQALGAQAATKIENARLSTETASQVEQGIVINELSRTISSTMDIEAMTRIIHDQIPSMTEAHDVYLALYDAATQEITFPMAYIDGQDIHLPSRPLGNDEVSFVIRSRRPLSLGDDYPSISEMRSNLGIENREGDITRYLGVPLIAGDQVLGVMAVRDSVSPRPFGLNDHRILTTIGTQLGAAIQNAQLFQQVNSFADDLTVRVEERTQELETERDRLESLYEITAEMGRTLDSERVLNRALVMVATTIKAHDGVVLLMDNTTKTLYSRTLLHLTEDSLNISKTATSEFAANATITHGGRGINGELERIYHPAEMLGDWLIANQDAVLIDDLHQKPYWDHRKDAGAVIWRSAVGVVLRTGAEIQGVIVFLGRKVNMFSEPQLKLVVAASNQVATAINNADLYSRLREQTDLLGTLLQTEREEAEKNSAILEGIADGVMLADANGHVVLFNGAAERILEIPRDFALDQPLSRLAGLYAGGQTWANTLSDWIKNPQPSNSDRQELVIDRLDFGRRVISVHASPVYTGEQFLGTVSVFRDVTKDVEVDRMKSEFISNVSHELRTPMTSIKGYADLLLMGGAGAVTDQQRHFLGTIKGNAERLADLVNDLLNISKLDSGTERMTYESFDVTELLDQAVANAQARADNQRKQISVETHIEPNLPHLTADRLKVSQIVTNLIDNAFNYTNAGGKIDIEAKLQDDALLVSVRDNGIGIPKDFQSRIWNRFERYEEHALVMDVAGTGLGLSIVKDLIEMHHGKVWVNSEINEGSTFSFTLPINGLS